MAIKDIIIWPEYLDARLSRKAGRRIPKSMAIHPLRKEDILLACKSIGVSCEIEEGKYYPRLWHSSYGFRIIVRIDENRGVSKEALIRMLAEALSKVKGC